MQVDQNFTSIKKNPTHQTTQYFMSPSVQSNILDNQLQQLQLLNIQEITQRLKFKKQQILAQSQQVINNSHQYFIDLTSAIIQVQNKIKRQIDKQTLSFLQKIDKRIEEIYENQHSYNCSSQTYQTLKILHTNFTETQQNIDEAKKVLARCYNVNLEGGLVEYGSSQVAMSTNKIYLNNSQFNTTSKKIHGNTFQVSERQFQLILVKFQEREEKLLITNERLKNKIKSLQEVLSKKGMNIKEFNRLNSAQNEKLSPEYWDLELERVKGENLILKEEIGNISNKLITLTSQNQCLKGEYKRMLQSNISQVSNPNNTQSYDILNNINDNSQMISGFESQQFIMQSQLVIKQAKQDEQNPSAICLNSNIQSNIIHNEMLIEYEKKNQQLTLELTKKLQQLQQLRSQVSTLQNKAKQMGKKIEQKQAEMQRLSHHCSTLQHDYEISSKKRFELEEKINLLKQTLKEKEEKEKTYNLDSQLRIENLQAMLKIKEEELIELNTQIQSKLKTQYESKMLELNGSKQILEKEMIICRNLMTELKQQNDSKLQKFKNEFKRMQKVITEKDQQLVHLRQEIYQVNRQNQQKDQIKKDQNSLTFKQKYENNKKELTKCKKQLKEKTKDFDNQKIENTKMNELLSIKCVEMNNRLELTVKEIQKLRTLYEGRIKLSQEKQKIMRQKFQFNMNQLLSQTQGKKVNILETIEKYIESMNNFSNKNAQLKKLKQEIKQLKTIKSMSNKNSKKQLTKQIDALGLSLQQNTQEISSLQKALFEDRLKVQKKIAEEKLSIYEEQNQLLKEKLNSKENEIKQIQQEILKVKKQVKKAQNSTRKQQTDQLANQNSLLQQKLQKLQAQLKSSKNLYKKSQEQLSVLQSELKKKRDHINNVKKQLTSNSDQVDELQFLLKNKSEQIEKLKRQLKDQSTKQTLVIQMREKLEQFQALQLANQQLKRQLQRNSNQSKYEISKLSNQLKQLKQQKKQELSKLIANKTIQLNEEINDLKTKNKKIKSELQRKDTLLQNIKLKQQIETKQLQQQIQQLTKELGKKSKEIENYQKKVQIMTINQRKHKQRSKLLTVVVQKVYMKVAEFVEKQAKEGNFGIKTNKLSKDKNNKKNFNTEQMLNNVSPIAIKVKDSNSNVFSHNLQTTPININKTDKYSTNYGSTQKNSTLQTLAQLDINLDDLEKYSQGLEMFGLNTLDLKGLQNNQHPQQKINFYETQHNQNSAFSHYMASPDNINKNERTNMLFTETITKSPQKVQSNTNRNVKQRLEQLSIYLSEKQQIDVGSILSVFDETIGKINYD